MTDQIEFKALDKFVDRVKEYEKKHKWVVYVISPMIVALIVFIVYAIKGVYPFGRNTIAYYDMPTQYVPFYSHAWDVLHGKASPFISWNIGSGVPMAGAIGNYIISPTNFFLFFTKRDNIIYALSFLLVIKMVLSAFAMSFYCQKKFSISSWTISAGVLYACSGYVLQYYSNIFFLDYVILFPLIIYTFERLMYENKFILFIFAMVLAFIPSFQFGAMVVLYLIFKAYFMLDSIPVDHKGYSIRLFLISGIIAALIASPVLIISVLVTLSSSRMELNSGLKYPDIIQNVFCSFRQQKFFMLYCGEIAISMLLLLVIYKRNFIKRYSKNIIMILIVILPILHEGINQLWHFGSYKHFPVRFGYMITFELLCFVGTVLKDNIISDIKIVSKVSKILSIASIPFIAYVLLGFFKGFLDKGSTDKGAYEAYKLYFITLVVVYLIIFIMESGKSKSFAILSMAIVQAFCGCYGLIAPTVGNADGHRVRYLFDSLKDKSVFDNQVDYSERIKCNLEEYESNYGLVVEQPTIAAWIYGTPLDMEHVMRDKMGYHGNQSTIMDNGGNAFTDAILGISKILSSYNPDPLLYKEINGKNGLYECRYKCPMGVVVTEDNISYDGNSFEYSNYLYNIITGCDGDLIEIHNISEYEERSRVLTYKEALDLKKDFINNFPIEDSELAEQVFSEVSKDEINIADYEDHTVDENGNGNREFSLSVPVNGKKSIYIDVADDFQGELSFKINGEYKYFSSYLTENSNIYPNEIYNGIAAFGSYDNTLLDIKIYTNNKTLDGVRIGFLDLDLLNEGIKNINDNQNVSVRFGKSSVNISGEVYKDGILFLPIGYSDSWHVKLNGKPANVIPFIDGAFLAVKVQKGQVNIDFTFRQKGFILGLVLMISGFGILFILDYLIKARVIIGSKLDKCLNIIFINGFKIFSIAILIIMYIIPICAKMAI